MLKSFLYIEFAPRQVLPLRGHAAFLSPVIFGNGEQFFRAIRIAIQYDILNRITQVPGQIIIDRKLAGVDDAHVHTGTNRVIQEGGMDCFANDVIASK